MSRASFKKYSDKEIYYIDYTYLNTEENFLSAINETSQFRKDFIENEKAPYSLLMLVDFTGSHIIGEISNRLKETDKYTAPYVKKHAMVGVIGVKAILLKTYAFFIKTNIKVFKTVAEAIDWLLKD